MAASWNPVSGQPFEQQSAFRGLVNHTLSELGAGIPSPQFLFRLMGKIEEYLAFQVDVNTKDSNDGPSSKQDVDMKDSDDRPSSKEADTRDGHISGQAYDPENLPTVLPYRDDEGLVHTANDMLDKIYGNCNCFDGKTNSSLDPSSPGKDCSGVQNSNPLKEEAAEGSNSAGKSITEKSGQAGEPDLLFMCPYFWCTRHTEKGFRSQPQLDRHLKSKRHTEDQKVGQYRPVGPVNGAPSARARQAGGKFRCEWPGCDRTYNKRQSLIAHRCTAHLNPGSWLCPVPGCKRSLEGKGFSQSSNRNQHVRKCHKEWKSTIEDQGLQDTIMA